MCTFLSNQDMSQCPSVPRHKLVINLNNRYVKEMTNRRYDVVSIRGPRPKVAGHLGHRDIVPAEKTPSCQEKALGTSG